MPPGALRSWWIRLELSPVAAAILRIDRHSRAAIAKHKGELGEADEKLVADYLEKAAKGQFGGKIFNELKETFTKPSDGNGETKQITPEPVSSPK